MTRSTFDRVIHKKERSIFPTNPAHLLLVSIDW